MLGCIVSNGSQLKVPRALELNKKEKWNNKKVRPSKSKEAGKNLKNVSGFD